MFLHNDFLLMAISVVQRVIVHLQALQIKIRARRISLLISADHFIRYLLLLLFGSKGYSFASLSSLLFSFRSFRFPLVTVILVKLDNCAISKQFIIEDMLCLWVIFRFESFQIYGKRALGLLFSYWNSHYHFQS